ncbi:MAG: hypothetical protein ACLQAR_02740 [Steroidobacteraceae bacterium]
MARTAIRARSGALRRADPRQDAELQVPQVAQVIENVAAGINQAAEDFENEIARR